MFCCFIQKLWNRFRKGVFNINCPWKLEFQNGEVDVKFNLISRLPERYER